MFLGKRRAHPRTRKPTERPRRESHSLLPGCRACVSSAQSSAPDNSSLSLPPDHRITILQFGCYAAASGRASDELRRGHRMLNRRSSFLGMSSGDRLGLLLHFPRW